MRGIAHHRHFKLTIWWLALGYFIFYAPYAASIKITTVGLWPGVSGPISGFRLLPAVVICTAIVLPTIVTLAGWWSHAGRRKCFGLSIPFPRPLILLSAFGTAVIIGTTTLIFTVPGLSIILALVFMRGGVLLMGPIVDRVFKRRVRWFSWGAFTLAIPAVLIALADVSHYGISNITAAIIVAYLTGYLLRLPCATKLAKSNDKAITYRYFVEEQMAATVCLVSIPAVFAFIGKGEIMMELRHGFTGFFSNGMTLPGLIIGALYACLYCFGTFIYLDRRENTYCIPLNRAASLLAGFVAAFTLALFFGQKLPSISQVGSAALLGMALLLLSPFHHVIEAAFSRFRHFFGSPMQQSSLRTPLHSSQRLFLFVCSGNTCRSPMAAAIAGAEIALRMQIPFAALTTVNAQALSAGIAARTGAPLTAEAEKVLRLMEVPVKSHAARNLSPELADQAEMIFCMTRSQRQAVIQMIPTVAGKTLCLDAEGDIDDPIGRGIDAYVECARRIRELIRLRFDELRPAIGLES